MSSLTAKQRLQSIRNLNFRIDNKMREVERIETMINRVVPDRERPRIMASKNYDGQMAAIDRLIELRNELNGMVDQYVNETRSIDRAIEAIDDPLHAQILIERYREGKSWTEVSKAVKHEESYTRRLCRRAEAEVEDNLRTIERSTEKHG